MDERERNQLIKKLKQYQGAPIPVPRSDVETVELPRPELKRDEETLGTVRLRFDVRGAPDYWTDVFNRGAGGQAWPPGLPIPTLDNDRIEVAHLPVGEVRRYVEALREYFVSTNREAERRRPEVEGRRAEAEVATRRFDEDFELAQRFLREEFGRSSD